MNSARWLAVILAAVGALALSATAFAAQQVITLPLGTTVQKVAPGHFKFNLPDGRVVEVRNYNPRTGIIGDSGIYDRMGRRASMGGGVLRGGMKPIGDPDPPPRGVGSPVRGLGDPDPPLSAFGDPDPPPSALGRSGQMMRGKGLQPGKFVQIDDEVTWLPATLVFHGTGLIDPDPPMKPMGLSPQPDPPGTRRMINPQPEPPGGPRMINPQPEPPKQMR